MIRGVVLNGTRSLKRRSYNSLLTRSNLSQLKLSDRHESSTISSPLHLHLFDRSHSFLLPRRDDDDEQRSEKLPVLQNTLSHNAPSFPNKTNSYSNGAFNQFLIREYHGTPAHDRGAAIVMSLGAIAATAKAGQYAVAAYKEWKASVEEERRLNEKLKASNAAEEETTQSSQGERKDENTATGEGGATADSNKQEEKRENFFAKFFNMSVGSKFYEGGFEEKMTRKEAALILGVRESSTSKRIKEAHRKLLILNHPDTGGSTYIAGKINEAKELLLKGRRG